MKSQSNDEGWWGFLHLCSQIKTVKQFDKYFNLFFTEEERASMALRYQIVKELVKGEKTQREIAKDLNVSIAKITRGSNSLKHAESNLKKLIADL